MPETAADSSLAQKASIELAMSGAPESLRRRAARLLDGTIFFSLLTLIVLITIPSGKGELWWEAAFECAVFALGLLWVIQCFLSGEWRVGGKHLLAPLLALTVFAFVQTLPLRSVNTVEGVGGVARRAVSADPFETWLFMFRLLALTLAGALLLRYTSNRHRLRALIHVVIGVGVTSALFGIVRQATQNVTWELNLDPPYVLWVNLLHLSPGEGYGQFANRNHFAFLMEMTLGLVLGLVAGGGARHNRLLVYLVAAAAPVWTALVLTTSRGAVLSMLSQIIFIALFVTSVRPLRGTPERVRGTSSRWRPINRSPVIRIVLIGCLVAVVAAGVMWVGGDPLVKRLESVPGELSTEGASGRSGTRRIEIWHATWQLIKVNPIVGAGFGAYRTAIPAYHDAPGVWVPEQAHNEYLELLASGGLIGAALGTWFIAAFINGARGRLRAADSFHRAAYLGALAGLFGVAVHSLFDYGLHITINALVFTALVVITMVNGRVEKKAPLSGPQRFTIGRF